MSAFWDAQRRAMQDQVDAATGETRDVMDHISRHVGGSRFIGGWGQISDGWRRTFQAYLEDHTLQMCPHAKNPTTVIVNAWDLGWMRCTDCNALAPQDSDDRCDGCRGSFPGEITPIIHQMGPVVFIGGLCPACRQREHDTGGGPT